jgi:hypothetical protein
MVALTSSTQPNETMSQKLRFKLSNLTRHAISSTLL